MSDQSDFIGKTLGTCTLVKLLGQGGMGVVYLAQQSRPARYVAVKILLPSVSPESRAYNEFLVRFRREADLIAKLEHVNIMPIYEYGEQDGLAYLVMPYLSGGSLRDVLAQRGALSLQETATYLDQSAYALTYAHSHGVIHRDIKPSNFLIHNDGRLVLADFGIARIMQENSSSTASSLTSTGMMVGTPNYMAPEMAHGQPIDHRADIYELGILLFQMLTGRVPFTGSTPLMVAVKHVQEPLPPLSQINPAISPAVDVVVMTATAKRPEDRYMSALDLAQAFRIAINTSPYSNYSHSNDVPMVPGSSLPQPGVPQQTIAPTMQQRYDTPSPIQYALPTTPVPLSTTPVPLSPAASRESLSGSGGIIAPNNVPVTPHVQPPTVPRSTSRILPILLGSLLALVFIAGGIFIAFKIEGGQTTSHNITTTPTAVTITTPTTIPTLPPTATTPPTPTATTPPTPTPTPTQQTSAQASATVQQYFDDINIRDYTDAYNLLGSKLQSRQTYDNFKSGFAHTEHDDIQIGAITSNSDGTWNVSVTIYATEDNVSGTGTHISTYQGYYVVGTENGQWKLRDASFKQVS